LKKLSQHLEVVPSSRPSSPIIVIQEASDAMFNTIQLMIEQALQNERDNIQEHLREMEEKEELET